MPRSCMRSRRSGAAFSSSSTSYQPSGIISATARSRSIARKARLWASRTARHAPTGSTSWSLDMTRYYQLRADARNAMMRAYTRIINASIERTTTMSATRQINGVELPSAGIWNIDPGHSEVGFVGRHFGLTKIRGRFTDVTGTVNIGNDIVLSEVVVTIEMASVGSGDQTRDDHLRSADFFDVERHPTATFRSTTVASAGVTGSIEGDLTIKGVTRPVTLDVEYLGYAADPWGGERAVFSASAAINREDWGLTWNMLLEAGGLLVSKEIRLEIEVELVREVLD